MKEMTIDILQISRDAREAKRHFDDVIDGSVGMYIAEDGYVGGLPVVFDTFKEMPPELTIPYPAVDGGQPFKDNVFSWVFKEHEPLIRRTFKHFVCATPGGSGAIAAVFHTMVPKGEHVLLPDIRWQYDRFSDPAGIEIRSHKLFNGDNFDLASFNTELEYLCQKQHRVVVVVNDPCQNPSGYTLTIEEWDAILSALNRKKENDIILLYDIAYIDYSCEIDQRYKASRLVSLDNHVNVFIAFSGSKTFGAYGMRLGALVGLSRNQAWIDTTRGKVTNFARGTWSCTPTPAIELLNRMFTAEKKEPFLAGLATARMTIIKRGQLFLEQAKAIGLPLIPYVNGFYVIIKCDHSYDVYQKLAATRIYAVPVSQGIRIALCSLRLCDIDGLPRRLMKIIF